MEYLSFRVAGVVKSIEHAKYKNSRIVIRQLVDDGIFLEIPHDDVAGTGSRIQQIIINQNGQNPTLVDVQLIEQLQVCRAPNL